MELLIENFYKPQDKNDWLPAFNRAINSISNKTSPISAFRSCTLKFASQNYYFSDTMHVTIPLHIMGSGCGYHSGTVFIFPKSKKGIIVHNQNTITDIRFTGSASVPVHKQNVSEAASSIIERIGIVSGDIKGNKSTLTPLTDFRESPTAPHLGANGITLYAAGIIRDCNITNFDGHGIYIFGFNVDQINNNIYTNSANWQLNNVTVSSCGGDGIHLYGTDTNIGTCIGSMFIWNAGWGIQDLSQIGQNNFIGGQASYNMLGGICRPYELRCRNFGTLKSYLQDYLPRLLADTSISSDVKKDWQTFTPVLISKLNSYSPSWDMVAHNFGSAFNTSSNSSWNEYNAYYQQYLTHINTIHQELLNVLNSSLPVNKKDAYNNVLLDNIPYMMGADMFISFYTESNGTAGNNIELNRLNFSLNSNIFGDEMQYDSRGFEHSFNNGSLATDRLHVRNRGGGTYISSNAMPGILQTQGEICFNPNPKAGGYIGWVNVNGVWKEFGKIEL